MELFFEGVGDHNRGEKPPFVDVTCIYCTVWTPMLGEAMLQVAPFVDITHIYCTVWTPMPGEAMLQVACGSSNSQN